MANLPDVVTASQYEALLAMDEDDVVEELLCQQHAGVEAGARLPHHPTPPGAGSRASNQSEAATPAQTYAFSTPSKQICPYASMFPMQQVPPSGRYYGYASLVHDTVQAWVRAKFGSWDALAEHWGVRIVPSC